MALWLHDMYLQIGFSPKSARLFTREKGLESTDKLRVLTDKDVNDICNVMRKPANRGQHISVISQEMSSYSIIVGDASLLGNHGV